MRLVRSVVVPALLLLGACAASTEPARGTAPPGATQPAAPEVSEEYEPVCHEESVTGSNMTRTVCRTRGQEERDRQDAQDFNARSGRIRQTIRDGAPPPRR